MLSNQVAMVNRTPISIVESHCWPLLASWPSCSLNFISLSEIVVTSCLLNSGSFGEVQSVCEPSSSSQPMLSTGVVHRIGHQENDRDRKASFICTSFLFGRRLCGKELPFGFLLFAYAVPSALYPFPFLPACQIVTQIFQIHTNVMSFLKAFLSQAPLPT